MNCYTSIKEAGEAGDLKKAIDIYSKTVQDVHMLNMLIVGAGNSYEKLSPEERPIQGKRFNEILWWAMARGGCLLFYTKSDSDVISAGSAHKADSFFTRVQMLKGPGEVQKGTFKDKK